MQTSTPSYIMFESFKHFAGISYKDLAYIILSDQVMAEGRSPRSKIEDKTWVSRYIVHAEYGSLVESYFADFVISSRAIVSLLKSEKCGKMQNNAIIDFFVGEGGTNMKNCLTTLGGDTAIYANLQESIQALTDKHPADAADLLVMQFIATGCLGDARLAATYVMEYAQKKLALTFKTSVPNTNKYDKECEKEETKNTQLCLCRVKDGNLISHPYPLTTNPEGTIIGLFATAANAINNVEPTVSRQHLRIWKSTDGNWYAEGMDSKNGTVLISGSDRCEHVIEPPRSKRDGFVSKPVCIQTSDMLCLAQDTVFMVMQTPSL